MTLLITSYIAGALTLLAPCILPILPIVLSGSLAEKRPWYPYLIVASLATSIVLFTILLKATTLLIDIPAFFWKILSGGILVGLGTIYIFPHIWSYMAQKLGMNRSYNTLDSAQDISSPLIRGVITGGALGPVFSTCSPTYTLLIATVFPASFLQGIDYTIIYALGLATMLIVVVLGGRGVTHKLGILAQEGGWFKRILGIIFICIGCMIIFGIDKQLESWVLDRFDIPSIEGYIIHSLF